MTDRVGQQLGNYRLVQLLGQGGFADVYLGEHFYLRTQAAIKILHTRLAHNDIEQFLHEAQTIAHLDYPHIIRVLDFGVEETTPYLVMNYAPNGTLRTLYPKGTRLLPAAVISYIMQIAPALQYAHEQKLVHRDVKPENLLVGRHDEILLSDFGIALVVQSSHNQSPQNLAGTIAYMAPEQIQAHPRPASDQYSLGVVVYEWLSGELPFNGTFAEIAVKHSTVPPPSLCEKVPDLSPALEKVVMTALAKEPRERFASVWDFAVALSQASQETTSDPIHLPSEFSRYGVQAEQSQQISAANTVSSLSRQETFVLPPPPPPVEPAHGQGTPVLSNAVHSYKTYLLVALALLVILGGSLGFVFFRGKLPTSAPPAATHGVSNRQPPTSTATATATPQILVTATEQAIATLGATSSNPYLPHTGTLVLNDPLTSSAAGNWDTSSSCRFSGGAYHVSVGPKTNACLYQSGSFVDFVYQAKLVFVSNDTCGGLIFFESDTFILNYYDFYICTDGSYHLDSFSTIRTPVRSGSSSAIQTNTGQANVIAIVAKGASLDLYINGAHIATATDKGSSYGSQIGFIVGNPSSSSEPAEAAFNNAKVWKL